jgi:nucleoside-diphosphate-sugar epimerase
MTSFKKILLTGGTGFIGSYLTRELLNKGYEGILKRSSANTWRIDDLINKIAVYTADITNTTNVEIVFSDFKPDVVYHLATYYAVQHRSSEMSTMVGTNVLGTINLLEASKNSSVELFVNTSSCFVYEQSDAKLKETDKLRPVNLYALTKLQAECACTFYVENNGARAVTLRLFPPYGPADNERKLIPFVIRSFLEGRKPNLSTGLQQWDFVNVHDIVKAYLKVLTVPRFKQKHEVFNIGTGDARSIRAVIAIIEQILGTQLEPNWGTMPQGRKEVWFNSADIIKAKNILAWQPETSLEEGLASTILWYRNYWKM